jgi:hypothetical protein
MRFAKYVGILVLLAIGITGGVHAQAPKAAHPAPWKRYCQRDGGFCFKYPPSWKLMGEIYNGNGVVVAPPQKDEEPLWNVVTVAMVAPPKDAGEALGLDGIVKEASAGMRDAGQNFQTLERSSRTVDGKPAQLLKAQYRQKDTGREWIEELVFIEGPDNEIYSVALKSLPQDVVRLGPVFNEIVRTWMLPEPEPPTTLDGPPAQTQTAPSNPPSTQPHF